MTPDVILIAAGCALLLIGLLGGGITSKWVNVGAVAGIARVLCGVSGLMLIAVGILLKVNPSIFSPGTYPSAVSEQATTSKTEDHSIEPVPVPLPTKVPSSAATDSDAENRVKFSILCMTYAGGYSLTFVFDKHITINCSSPSANQGGFINVFVPKSESYSYIALGVIHTEGPIIGGSVPRDLPVRGSGMIQVVPNRKFIIVDEYLKNKVSLLAQEDTPKEGPVQLLGLPVAPPP